jgi:formylglycine-generating enzyme required for sulfatase activity
MFRVIHDDDFTPELIVLSRGNFMMGSLDNDSLSYDDERPRHSVKINHRIGVGRSPVTFEEWDHYVKDAAWHRSRHVRPYKPSDEGWRRKRRPVINVGWDDVQRYLRWLSDKTNHLYRLLSEPEWEYACRAGRDTAYNIGSGTTHSDANYGKNVGKTVEVGIYPPNGWGLHDMHGNVWEWVEDCWHGYETPGRPDDGSAWTSGDCRVRVLRGGAWYNLPRDLRSACRFKLSCENRLSYIGFRVARTIP